MKYINRKYISDHSKYHSEKIIKVIKHIIDMQNEAKKSIISNEIKNVFTNSKFNVQFSTNLDSRSMSVFEFTSSQSDRSEINTKIISISKKLKFQNDLSFTFMINKSKNSVFSKKKINFSFINEFSTEFSDFKNTAFCNSFFFSFESSLAIINSRSLSLQELNSSQNYFLRIKNSSLFSYIFFSVSCIFYIYFFKIEFIFLNRI